MTLFKDLGLKPEILEAIGKMGFETPTPVQEKVIPFLLEHSQDITALAQTGTGKTAAFGLPILQLINSESKATQALVLCPTRELCMQITRDMESFSAKSKHIRTLAVYGGTPIDKQIRALNKGVQVIVATPGRMKDLLNRGKANLSKVNKVVLDEADEMLNMGFLEDLEDILECVPDEAQKLLFSATMPASVARIASNYMNDAHEVTVGKRNAGAEQVTHEFYMIHAKDRYLSLKRIADFYPDMYSIIFCRTRAETQDVAKRLIHDGYNADALHGDLSQAQRDRVMDNFRSKNLQMLVATDVAARGLDVNDLTHVINYNLPDDVENYTHRSGRTGRAGKEGTSIVIVHTRERHKIGRIEKIIGKKFEKKQIPTGKEICESQLYHLINRVKSVDIDHKQIDQYLSQIYSTLEDMSREDLIKHFVSLEFNRFLGYYRNAPNLNIDDSGKKRKIETRLSGNNITRLFINLGKMDNLTPKSLIGLINASTPGYTVAVGDIDLKIKYSFFEVGSDDVEVLLKGINRQSYDGRKVAVEVVQTPKRGGEGSNKGEGSAPQRRKASQSKGKKNKPEPWFENISNKNPSNRKKKAKRKPRKNRRANKS